MRSSSAAMGAAVNVLGHGESLVAESSGSPCRVKDFLGAGGQGEVYSANFDGQLVALKWYHQQWCTQEQRKALELLIQKGSPSEKFLWPMDMIVNPGRPGFGYIMPLRDPQFKSLVDLLKRRVVPSMRALATTGLQLSHSFLLLHSKGLCYRDISLGNVFFEPSTGNVLICDNDNVGVDAAGHGGVLGTPDFMAPEVVRGEALPSTETDLFSLSVLLFYMFHIHHPLYGKRVLEIASLDLNARTRLSGTDPVFIFDEQNRVNEALPWEKDPSGEAGGNAVELWRIYPPFLRQLFTKAFTVGLKDPRRRVRESEWRVAMVKLRDSIIYCPQGHESFYLAEGDGSPPPPGAPKRKCWVCGMDIPMPPRIRIGKHEVTLNHDTQLFPHHVDDTRMYDFSAPVAQVVQRPQQPGVWGIRNLTTRAWTSVAPDGASTQVDPGKSVTLLVGRKIDFGRAQGTIEQ